MRERITGRRRQSGTSHQILVQPEHVGSVQRPWRVFGLGGRELGRDHSEQAVARGQEVGELVTFGISQRGTYPHLGITPGSARRVPAPAPVRDCAAAYPHVDTGPEVGQPVADPGGKNGRQARRVQ